MWSIITLTRPGRKKQISKTPARRKKSHAKTAQRQKQRQKRNTRRNRIIEGMNHPTPEKSTQLT